MTHTFRRCMVQGPAATLYPDGTDAISYNVNGVYPNVDLMLETGSRWIRLWAYWSVLQPYAPDPNNPDRTHNIGQAATPNGNSHGQSPNTHWARIADQVRFIRNHPDQRIRDLRIIITAIEFPDWSNPVNNAGGTSRRQYVFPDNLSPTGPWANWIGWLFRTFSAGAERVDAIEVVNEPNIQCYPHATSRGNSACWVSQMFSSAVAQRAAKSRDLGMAEDAMPALMGPATSDKFNIDAPSRERDYNTFTNDLIGQLLAARFAAPRSFVWTHHNYRDVEYDLGVGSTAPSGAADECPQLNRASQVRKLLTWRWSGGPYGDPAAPYVFITEGGCRRRTEWFSDWSINGTNPQDSAQADAKQGELVQRNLLRMQNEEDGKGIGMVATYLFFAAPGDRENDSSLRNSVVGTTFGRKREPAYRYWSQAPSHGNLGD